MSFLRIKVSLVLGLVTEAFSPDTAAKSSALHEPKTLSFKTKAEM